jgi:hypothetical protein
VLLNEMEHFSYIDPRCYRACFNVIGHLVSSLLHSLGSIHSIPPWRMFVGGAVIVISFAARHLVKSLAFPRHLD